MNELIRDINLLFFLADSDDRESCDESPPPLSWPLPSPTRSLASVVRSVCAPLEAETRPALPPSAPPAAEVTPTEPEANTEDDDVLPVDPELLLALGTLEAESDEWGPDISEDLTKRWEPILKDGLKKEVKEDLLKKYQCPKNCPLVKPPILNPEIRAMLNESARNRDTRILKKQSQLACALTVLGKTMSDILTKSIEMPAILQNLSDATKILANSHYSETEKRRSLVMPMVDKTFIEPFKDRKRDSHLFGEKLSDFIKSSRGLQKTGKFLQSTASSTSNLNSKPAPPRGRSNNRGAQYRNRGGADGARATAPAYRRRPTTYQPPSNRGQRASTPTPTAPQRYKRSGTTKPKQ